MPLISSGLLLRSLCVFHAGLGYALLTKPDLIIRQSIVFVLGESMQIPSAKGFDNLSGATALAGLLFALFALSDFVSIGSSDVSRRWWSMQAPIRLVFFFGLAGWCYVSNYGIRGSRRYLGKNGGVGVANDVIFTWCFIEMVAWFSIFNTLREEKREFDLQAAIAAEKRLEQELELEQD